MKDAAFHLMPGDLASISSYLVHCVFNIMMSILLVMLEKYQFKLRVQISEVEEPITIIRYVDKSNLYPVAYYTLVITDVMIGPGI